MVCLAIDLSVHDFSGLSQLSSVSCILTGKVKTYELIMQSEYKADLVDIQADMSLCWAQRPLSGISCDSAQI